MRRLTFVVLIAMLFAATGCHRSYYRRQADNEAYDLIRQKGDHPHWALPNISISPDPRSRLFDPSCPDCPPLPPDDPYAHELMHCVDHKRGYPGWHDNGETPYVENPAWPEYLEFTPEGVMKVRADDAVRLGLLHSRAYQQELEELYLSALDVSFERFLFDSQYFAGYSGQYTADGRLRNDPARLLNAGGNSRSDFLLATSSNGPRPIAVRKAFTTGSTLVVGLANSLMWQFSGPDDYRGNTLIDFALVQPLLRNAGRDRIMERLTVAERSLLYNVRSMEQYRQGFYVQVMTGRDPGQGPQRRGGVFGGSGFEGFTGVGGGGFGRVSTTGATTVQAGGGGQGAGAGAVGGYLGLLQTQQNIRNQEDNVKRLRNNLYRLEEFLDELKTRSGEVGLVNNILRQDLQVAQARQALFNSESRLINSRNDYQATLDNFKGTLGLPPTICMEVNDNTLDQFQLIDRATLQEQDTIENLVEEFSTVRSKITAHIESRPAPDPNDATRTIVVNTLNWYPELPDHLRELQQTLKPVREVRERLLTDYLPRTATDLAAFQTSLKHRREWLTKLKKTIEELRAEGCAILPIPTLNEEIFRLQRLEDSRREVMVQFESLKNKVQNDYLAHLDERDSRLKNLLETGETLKPDQLFASLYHGILYPKQGEQQPMRAVPAGEDVTDILVVLPADILALQLVQARARAEGIELTPIDLKWEQAVEVARKYRRDWMNARAGLVDAWRLIEFNADNLEGSLDVFFSGDVQNVTDNPFRLRSATGRLRLGIAFDAPLTRLSERNVYRQALIEYQQARRNYYNFEDTVARGLRTTMRTVLTNQINFELQRLAVLEAARQIDRNEDIRIDQELTNQASGATAARDSVSALSDLLDAQNNFMSVWVNYEALRRSLDFDLGTLQLDSEGLWMDPGAIKEDYGTYDPWLWRCPEQPQACYDGATEIPVAPYPQFESQNGEFMGEPYLVPNEQIPTPSPQPAKAAPHHATPKNDAPQLPTPQPTPAPRSVRPKAEPQPVPQETKVIDPATPLPVIGPQLDPAAYYSDKSPATPASFNIEGMQRPVKSLRK
ncbi:hypothetical protein [Anatilimnocola floriformis]|uniref:hypothetical protein n=1 Tax=Anatilimnocola floriformis TaxID=2948575 RepID=UPI0020C4CD89|nr:hypothetical protein [Anatilimnocola floriformis]